MLLNVKSFVIRLSAPLIRICNQNCTKYGMSYVKNISSSASLRNELLSEKIQSRKLVKISGADAPSFLQGLVTNDVRIFETSTQDLLMYCMMLNTQGRILYDLLVYKVSKFFDKDSSIILECDSRASDDLLKTLSRYKLRRKAISFSKIEEYSVWSVFPKSKTSPSSSATTTSPSLASEASDIKSDLPLRNPEKLLFHSLDPRIPNFGRRLLLPAEVKGSEVIEGCKDVVDEYENRRFDFGLSEGTEELMPGQSFPLECNLFFLNGASFSKGCYVGQELTARTHHTGVIRKRIMPIFSRGQIPLSKVHGEGLVIVCEASNKECGKVLNWRDRKGLALLRLHEALLSPGPLLMKNPGGLVLGQVETFVPDWWPSDVDEVIKKVRSKQEKV